MSHHPRLNTYHSQKRRLLGTGQAAQAAPAWKTTGARRTPSGSQSQSEVGSKILMSRLPPDVTESEVETLFARTVGPVKEVIMVYNSQAHSRGMAVVSFARPTDAAVARSKYHGKIVDGRISIKIEIVVDDDDVRKPLPPAAPPTQPPSLLQRLGPVPSSPVVNGNGRNVSGKAPVANNNAPVPVPVTRVNLREKKGPRRLNKQRGRGQPQAQIQGQQQQQQQQQPQKQPANTKQKQQPKTLEQLDAEMEDYRAASGATV